MGTSIEAECKAHRLMADVFCDVAMVLDCLSLSLPTTYRLPVLCLSSTLFAASGVSGRSAKSSLSSHFAKWNNIAELNAVSEQRRWMRVLRLMRIQDRIESGDCRLTSGHATRIHCRLPVSQSIGNMDPDILPTISPSSTEYRCCQSGEITHHKPPTRQHPAVISSRDRQSPKAQGRRSSRNDIRKSGWLSLQMAIWTRNRPLRLRCLSQKSTRLPTTKSIKLNHKVSKTTRNQSRNNNQSIP